MNFLLSYRSFAFLLILVLSFQNTKAQEARKRVEVPFDSSGTAIEQEYFVVDTGSLVLDGPYTSYFLNGETRVRGQYRLGKPVGTWTYFYENRKVKVKTVYDSLLSKELWIYFFENGKIQRSGPVVSGEKEGIWNYYYESGEKKEFGRYRMNKRDGVWKYYFEDGSLKAQTLYTLGTGWYEGFYPSGSKKMDGRIQNGKSDSLWTYYFQEGGIKAQGMELDGKKNGRWKFFYEDGNLRSEGDYTVGLRTGPWKYYYLDGKLQSEGQMKADLENGYWKMYYEDGSVLGEGDYDEGTGKYREFFPNGKIKIEGNKEEGEYSGKWYFYYEDGTLEGEADYVQGKGKYSGYYSDGSRKMEGDLHNGAKVGLWSLYNPDGTLAGTFEKIEENEEPIYEPAEEEEEQKELAIMTPPKSKYKYKTRKGWRYFTPRMNEYRSFIVGANPIATFFGSFPMALEYYYQERLGYEILLVFLRDPFYSTKSTVPEYKVYNRGVAAALKQKMYFDQNLYGLFYFGHEIRYTLNNYFVNVPNETNIGFSPTMEQNMIEYSVFVGDRVFQSTANRGFTLDLWAGIGVGVRFTEKNWENLPEVDDLFSGVNQNTISVPLRIGVTVGYMFRYNPSPLYQKK